MRAPPATPSKTIVSRSSTTEQNASPQDPAFLSANYAYQPRPASIRSISTSSIQSDGAGDVPRSRTPDGVGSTSTPSSSTMTDTRALPSRPLQSRSPSHHAALVAAARARLIQAQQSTTSPKGLSRPGPASHRTVSIDNDTTSIPPTTSLVSLFEQKSSTSAVPTARSGPPIQSPKPRRQDGSVEVLEVEAGSRERPQGEKVIPQGILQLEGSTEKRADNELLVQQRSREVQGQTNSTYDSTSSRARSSGINNDTSSGRPSTSGITNDGFISRSNASLRPYSISSPSDTNKSAVNSNRNNSGTISALSATIINHNDPSTVGADTIEKHDFARPNHEAVDSKPVNSPPSVAPRRTQLSLARTQTAPIDIRPRPRELPSMPSSQSVSAAYRQAYPKKTTPLTTDDELANAIVASSLASTRMSSSQKREVPHPPLSRRQSRHHIFHHSRTPSPVKQSGVLRQTLRKQQDSSDSDDGDSTHPYNKHQKKRLIRKHPNKHHEGDRKRWRDAVTDTERKRYEGVWAANKGLHVIPMPRDSESRVDSDVLSDQVSNVVVKDIWTRSRLPDFELETVWDLVDTEGIGRLSKEEFVVGMWLIDQRLKGRKLPVKVTPTVWASVRGLQGIKIRKQ